MNMFTRILFALGYGVVVGSAITDAVAPTVLTWYNIPGMGQALCNCADLVSSTSSSVIHAHWIGGALGGVAFAVAAVVIGGKKAPTKAAPAA